MRRSENIALKQGWCIIELYFLWPKQMGIQSKTEVVEGPSKSERNRMQEVGESRASAVR